MSDLISRQQTIDALRDAENHAFSSYYQGLKKAHKIIAGLSSAHPEIIRCRECKFASGDSRICMKFGHSPIDELDFCAWAERRTDE